MINESTGMAQIIEEAASGIGDIIKEIAEPNNGGFRLRENRPDVLVVDPFVQPLFKQAEALAQELGIPMPKTVIEPTLGIHELLETRYWSRVGYDLPEVNKAPMRWLDSTGFGQTRELLSRFAQANGEKSPRLVAIGGSRDSELPYVERADEKVRLGRGRNKAVELNQLYLTPNYFPQEDGPLDMEALAEQAFQDKEAILQHIKSR